MQRATLWAILGLLALPSCGRFHTLRDGTWLLSVRDVIRDDCGLAASYVTSGRLVTTGNLLRFRYDLFGIELVGSYLSKREEFRLDGSAANVSTDVNQTACLLDLVTLHLDATPRDELHFDGLLSARLDARRPEACVCELWVTYTATHSSAAAP